MHHLAILAKKRKLLAKIISGEKTIESRWYKTKRTPYNNIKTNDTIYFKDSGEPITVQATVEKVLFFDLRHTKVNNLIEKYADRIGLKQRDPQEYAKFNYCTLIWLKEVKEIPKFNINKQGYGNMAAWITLEDISQIKI